MLLIVFIFFGYNCCDYYLLSLLLLLASLLSLLEKLLRHLGFNVVLDSGLEGLRFRVQCSWPEALGFGLWGWGFDIWVVVNIMVPFWVP